MSEFYKPRQAYLYDTDKEAIIGRYRFQIGGEMSDGTKCWYMVDDNGDIIDTPWYSMHKQKAGYMIAIEEGR